MKPPDWSKTLEDSEIANYKERQTAQKLKEAKTEFLHHVRSSVFAKIKRTLQEKGRHVEIKGFPDEALLSIHLPKRGTFRYRLKVERLKSDLVVWRRMEIESRCLSKPTKFEPFDKPVPMEEETSHMLFFLYGIDIERDIFQKYQNYTRTCH